MKLKLKILLTLVVAFLISSVASDTVFIAGTPYLNNPFIDEVASSPGVFFSRTSSYFASIGQGKSGVENYQQARVRDYQAAQSNESSSLPQPVRPEEFALQGYTQSAPQIYSKSNDAANTVYIYVSADAKFEKRMIEIGGEQVEAWIPL